MKWGWLIAVIAIAIILWIVLRPTHAPDNTKQQHYVDSLLGSNGELRSAVQTEYNERLRYKDSATKVIDSLLGRNIIILSHATKVLTANLSLARQIQYYKSIQDTSGYDSSCDMLAQRVIIDSALIQDYQNNTDKIINSFGNLVDRQDSLTIAQHGLILSDSVTIAAQKNLNRTQSDQISKLVRKGKVAAWIGRSLALVAGILTIIIAVK